MTIDNMTRYTTWILIAMLFFSCSKEAADRGTSSVRIVPSVHEPKLVKAAVSRAGNLLVYFSSEDLTTVPTAQELFILNPAGEVLHTVHLSDTIFQYIHAIPALDGGFFLCATSNTFSSITLFHIGDDAGITWSKHIPVTNGTSLDGVYAAPGLDNSYLVMYRSYGWGFYIWKGDVSGNDIFTKKIPSPNAYHYGTGYDIDEKYARLIQVNDTLIVIQAFTVDQYQEFIENCFLRGVDQDIVKKWYSNNYNSQHIFDSLHIEKAGALLINGNHLLLFGSKSEKTIQEGFGDVFARSFSLSGATLGETIYPRVNGTPTMIRAGIKAAGGEYLLVGSNNQLPANDLVSNNHIVVMKINSDLTQAWSHEIQTGFPAKGYDLASLPDGSIAVIGLLKQDYARNVIMYLHLDANGEIIKN